MRALLLSAVVIISFTFGGASIAAQQAGKKEFELRGKVEKVDAQSKKLTINHEKVDGWMAAMTMSYKVDKEDILKSVKAGDQITARVYEGDFETVYNVQKVAADAKK